MSAAPFETLLVEQEGSILWVRLNRPEVLNAYTSQMGAELVRAIRRPMLMIASRWWS